MLLSNGRCVSRASWVSFGEMEHRTTFLWSDVNLSMNKRISQSVSGSRGATARKNNTHTYTGKAIKMPRVISYAMKRKCTSVAGLFISLFECGAVGCEGQTLKRVLTSVLTDLALCSERVSQRVFRRALRDWLLILNEA